MANSVSVQWYKRIHHYVIKGCEPFSSLFYFFSISLLFLLLLVALKLRSLRFHSPRLCRVAVFLIQTNVSLSLSSPDSGSLSPHGYRYLFSVVFLCKTHRFDTTNVSLPLHTIVQPGTNIIWIRIQRKCISVSFCLSPPSTQLWLAGLHLSCTSLPQPISIIIVVSK